VEERYFKNILRKTKVTIAKTSVMAMGKNRFTFGCHGNLFLFTDMVLGRYKGNICFFSCIVKYEGDIPYSI
jgi:hypothetical protein